MSNHLEIFDEANVERSKSSSSLENDQSPGTATLISRWFTPNSKLRVSWNAFIFMAIWYNSIVTPIRLFIIPFDRTPQGVIEADIVFDFIFLIDTILSFFIPYTDENTGEIITDPKAIRQKYAGSFNFFINVIACIPILKSPISYFLNSEAQTVLVTNFNILRMIRVLHFQSQFQELKRYRSRNGPVNESVFRMGVILFFAFLVMCIFGCVYFGWSTSKVENMCPDPNEFESAILNVDMWVAEDFVITDVMDPDICGKAQIGPACNDCPQMLFLTRSIYFLMQTLFTIGYGDSVVPSKSSVEMAMACLFMVFGVFGYGLIIANMTSVLSNVDVVSMRFRRDMDNVTRWLTLRRVPQHLREHIRMFFTYLNKNQNGMLDEHLFSDLPPKLCQDFGNQYIDLLSNVPFFDKKIRSAAFISKIAKALIRRIYPPGSCILYQYEKQRELIIMKKGKAEIFLRGNRDAIGFLQPGEFMGDYQLLFGTVNQVGLRSQDFVEVLVLTYSNFERVMAGPLEDQFEFISSAGNFRGSNDEGALQTVRNSITTMEKLSLAADDMSKIVNKVKNKSKGSDRIVQGYRIYPNSKIHVGWDLFALFSIMFYCIACSVELAKLYRRNKFREGHDYIHIMAYFMDACFLIDIFLRMNYYAYISYETGRNEIIDNRDMMRQTYMKGNNFKLDLVASLPIDLLALRFRRHPALRLTKMIRALQIPHFLSALQQHLEDSCKIILNETHVSILLMFLFSMLIMIWISSGWYAIRTEETAYDSVYWALTTLTTVGYGDLTPVNLPQTIFALFVGAAGATFSAAIIANVTSFFHDVEIAEDSTDHKLNCVKHFMERHNVSLEHTKRINDYFDFIERDQDGLNEEELLKTAVPDHIRSSLLIHITQSMILHCTFFDNCESGFIRKIMQNIEQRFYGTGFNIISLATPSDGMYFVKKGIVALLKRKQDETVKVIRKVKADQSFAEDCLLKPWSKNPYFAKALADSELWFLSRSTFNQVIQDFPKSHSILIRQMATNTRENIKRRKSIFDVQQTIMKSDRSGLFFIHPDSMFIQCWFGVILLVILYSVVVLPFRIAFMENHEISVGWLTSDYLGDVLFLADIIIRGCFLGYYEDNHLVTSRAKILSNYIHSAKAKWHVISFVPLEVFFFFFPTFCPFWKLQFWSILRLNKVLRAVEISYIFHRVESSLAKIGVKVPKNPLRVWKLLMLTLLSAHWVACIFFIIANLNHHSFSLEDQKNWAKIEGILGDNPECPGVAIETPAMMKQYVASLYFSVATLTTVGYGDITASEDSAPEIIFATVILIIGTGIYTLVIALLEDIVSQLDVTSSLYKMKMNNIGTYMQLLGLPDSIKNKTTAYYDHLWRTQLGVKGKSLLKYMPRSLRCDMKIDMLSHLIPKTFFINNCSADFIANIVDALTLEIYLPDDNIFDEGQRCDALHYIYSGEVGLFTSKKVKFKTVSNCVLSEGFFFSFEPHACTAKALDSCEVFQLSMKDFLSKLNENKLLEDFISYVEENENVLIQSKASIIKMIQNLKSSKMAKMMVVDVDTSIPKGVIAPDTKFRKIWDFFTLAAVIVFAIRIPQQISFSALKVELFNFLVDLFLDLFFLLDIYARMNHFAITEDGVLVSSPKEFRKVYIKTELIGDLVSIVPASTIGWILNVNGRIYGLMRLIQIVRLQRFAKYFNCSIDALYETFHVVISTAVLRIIQIFLLVILLCHWLGCIYHLIGDLEGGDENWLDVDEIKDSSIGFKYLRSFYWALYTVTTVGYGSVPVISIPERVFAMFVMFVGAVICDAGITAVLTSIISRKDHQAGTNNRRIQCSKKFMLSNFINKNIQDSVLDFYHYIDTEMKNINEEIILNDLSTPIKREILHLFCFEPLRKCCTLQNLSDGAITSLLDLMTPYLAIPGEKICEIGKSCESIFVLQRGRMFSVDEKETKTYIPIGTSIGHMITDAIERNDGPATSCLTLEILSSNGFKGKSNPYIEASCGSKVIRSSIRRGGTDWKEVMTLKLCEIDDTLCLRVKGWHKNSRHNVLGEAEVNLEFESDEKRRISFIDGHGKKIGTIMIRITYYPLDETSRISTLALTATAIGYCHLYQLQLVDVKNMESYVSRSKLPRIKDRMSIAKDNCIDLERKLDGWKLSSSSKVQEIDTSSSRKDSGVGIGKRGRSLQKIWNQIDKNRRVPAIAPADIDSNIQIDPEHYRKERIRKRPKSHEARYDDFCGENTSLNSLDSAEIDWDNLVEFSDMSKMVNETNTGTQNFFMEWASDDD